MRDAHELNYVKAPFYPRRSFPCDMHGGTSMDFQDVHERNCDACLKNYLGDSDFQRLRRARLAFTRRQAGFNTLRGFILDKADRLNRIGHVYRANTVGAVATHVAALLYAAIKQPFSGVLSFRG